MGLMTRMQLFDQDINSTSTTQGGASLGQVGETDDGRSYAYGLNGSSSVALSPGKLAQGAVTVANHVNRTGVTYVAGTQQVVFTIGNTAITAGQYTDGYFYVNAGTGAGQALLIDGTTSPAGNGTVTVNLADGLITATAVADSKFSLHPNPYSAGLISDHTNPTTVVPLGVPNVSIPASSYGWFQIGGPSSVLANGTPAVGGSVIPGATTDGSVDVDGASSVQPKIGYCLMTAVSAEYRMVQLTINPR